MKIAVIGMRGFPNVIGGIETHAENLYPRLAAMGCEAVAFVRKPYVEAGLEEYRGVRLVRLPSFRNKYLETFAHTLLAVFAARTVGPDVLHVHAIGPALFIPVARLLGMRVVMTHHGPDYERQKWGKLAKAVLRTGEKLGCRWSDRVICISEHVATGIREKHGCDSTVIPNGVDVPAETYGSGCLKRYGLTEGKYVLAVGRLVPEKGFHDLIEAFRSAWNSDCGRDAGGRRSLEGWKLAIVGDAVHDDAYSAKLKEEAAGKDGAGAPVVFTGFLTGRPLREIYAHAGLFVLPSYHEGLPIVLLEAMSHGLSCLASDIPANRGVGLAEERYFRPGDVKSLSLEILDRVGDPLSRRAREEEIGFVRERFSWERIAEKTLEVYRRVAAGGRQ